LLTEVHDEIRNIAFNLMPPVLVKEGLVSAVQELVRKINKSGRIKASLSVFDVSGRFQQVAEISLYRVVQEFLSNIIGVETEIFDSQIPGGMISNMESQLKQQGAGDRMDDVLAEVPRVRKDAGYPPLVTPSSQIVGTQAVFNVMMGRYKVLTGEFADLMLGYYGHTIGSRDRHVIELAIKQGKKEPIEIRPADLLKDEWEHLRASALELKGCDGTDEDVLTYAMFPQVAPKFFGTRAQGPKNLGKDPNSKPAPAAAPPVDTGSGPVREPIAYEVTLNGRTHKITVAPA